MYLANLVNNFSFYYTATHKRAFPYLVGILLGYDVATTKRHLTKTNVAIYWMFTGLLILFLAEGAAFDDNTINSSLLIERPTIVVTKILLDKRDRNPTVVTAVKESNNESNLAVTKDSMSKIH